GPWLDRVRRLDDPRAEPLVRLTKGTHVVVPRQRLGNTHAVTLTSPIDGRVMFILPWGDQSYIGTTDTDEDVSPDDVRASPEAAKARGALESGARHLVRNYGSESPAVLNLVDRDRGLGRPIVAGRPEIWAEVVHGVEREMAMRLADVLVRRLHLFYEAGGYAAGVAPAVAARMADLLGWDAERVALELAEYRALADRARNFLSEMSQPHQEPG